MALRYWWKKFLSSPSTALLKIVVSACAIAGIAGYTSAVGSLKMHIARELTSFGANIIVEKKNGSFEESDAIKAKEIFWRHNIEGVSPVVEFPAFVLHQGHRTRVKVLSLWFEKDLINSAGEKSSTSILKIIPLLPALEKVNLGAVVPQWLNVPEGSTVEFVTPYGAIKLPITGVYENAGAFNGYVFVPLELLTEKFGEKIKLRKILISAATVPEDEFARRDPSTMTRREFDKWYCTPYLSSILHQLKEAFPEAQVRPLEGEREKRERIFHWVYKNYILATALLLLASGLALWGANLVAGESIKGEIALWRALGASSKDAIRFTLLGNLIEQLLAFTLAVPMSLYTLLQLVVLLGKSFSPDISVVSLSVAGAFITVLAINMVYPWSVINKVDIQELLRK